MLYNLIQIFNNKCVEEVEEEIEVENKKARGNENENETKMKSHKHRLSTFTNNIVKVPSIITFSVSWNIKC